MTEAKHERLEEIQKRAREYDWNTMDGEIWRDIPDYEDWYQVSNYGRARSLNRVTRNKRSFKGNILTLTELNGGYLGANLHREMHNKRFSIHSLVMLAFVGQRPEGYDINHKDGNKHNNRLHNLEYCTRIENIQHSIRYGLRRRKIIMPCFKVGDKVLTPDGHIGIVEEIDRNYWKGRNDKPIRLHHYYVPSPKSGTPIVWWLARQLKRK